jgi:hypothetical protein
MRRKLEIHKVSRPCDRPIYYIIDANTKTTLAELVYKPKAKAYLFHSFEVVEWTTQDLVMVMRWQDKINTKEER